MVLEIRSESYYYVFKECNCDSYFFFQAAEKALKAAQYSVDSNKTNVHNLVQNSLTLKDSNLTSLSSNLESLLGDSTRMRYPDQVCCPRIPSDIYTHEMACEALRLATKILDNVRSKVQ